MDNELIIAFDKHSNYLDSSDRDVKKRITTLKNLKKFFSIHLDDIYDALKRDLNKSKVEAYFSEVKPVLDEIDWFIKNLKKELKPTKVKVKDGFKSKSFFTKEPYGTSLSITQSGLPINKFFIPFIGIYSCGNTFFAKLPISTTKCNAIIKKIVTSVFDDSIVYFVDENISPEGFKSLLELNFDLVFFSGTQLFSKTINKAFLNKNTKLLVETHSKCPIIIDETADIQKAAMESVWGKALSAGQFNFSPDYIVIHESVVKSFVKYFKEYLQLQYGNENHQYLSRIANKNKFDKLNNLLEKAKQSKKVLCGGNVDNSLLTIEPTLVSVDNLKSPFLTLELKGTIFPVVIYNNFPDIIGIVKHNENPSSVYIFSKSKERINNLIKNLETRYFVVNSVAYQVGKEIPLGGLKKSGNIEYGRKASIESFSYKKFVLKVSSLDKSKYPNNWSKKRKTKKLM